MFPLPSVNSSICSLTPSVAGGPSGNDAAYLYGAISTSGGSQSGSFEPNMTTIDYAGPSGFTSETAKRITVQSGYDGDFLGCFYGSIPSTGSIECSVSDVANGGTLKRQTEQAHAAAVGTAWGRHKTAQISGPMVDGDYYQSGMYVFGTNTLAAARLAMLRPGRLLGSIGRTTNPTILNSTTIPFDTYVGGDSDYVETANNGVRINATGWYLVHGGFRTSSNITTTGVIINGSTTGGIAQYRVQAGSGFNGSNAVGIAYLVKDELVTATAYTNASATGVAADCTLSVWRLRDSDVLGILSLSSDYTVPNSTAGTKEVLLDTVEHGSGALVATSGKFTIQTTGWYLGWYQTSTSRASASTCYHGPSIKNDTTGDIICSHGFEIAQAAGTAHAQCSMFPFYATAGDVIGSYVYVINGQPAVTLKSDEYTRMGLIALDAVS